MKIYFISNSDISKHQRIFNNKIKTQIEYFDNIKLELEGDCSIVDESMKTFKENYENAIKNGQDGKKDFYKEHFNYFKRNKMPQSKFLKIDKDEFYKLLYSINDINLESKPIIFDEELLLNTFGNYFIKFENHKRDLEKKYQDKSVKEIYDMVENEAGKNPLDRINEILAEYYGKYELEIIKEGFYEIKLVCIERQSKISVPMNNLSLGEQIIISLIMWQYEDTTLDSTILLLDEPDAHLNPKMAKMLIDILKNVVVKEFDCQVIMTTHSLSSIAYCENEDLFFMENGKIRKIDKKEAIEKLSDGIMTFDNAMNKIEQIQNSNKQILMVEGVSDRLHIENFYKLLKKEIPFEIIECGGADNMSHFAIAFTQLKIPKENILFLCDYDKVGYKINNKIIKQGYNAIYTLDIEHLNQDDDKIRLKNYPIEMLYPFNILKENNLLEELALKEFIDNLDKEKQKEKSDYFSTNISVNDKEKYKLVDNDSIKSNFAREIIDKLDIENDFKELENLIDRIEKILIK